VTIEKASAREPRRSKQTMMSVTPSDPIYPLGNTQAEHERLARQAATYAPMTERIFRCAGIGAGQRVLDLGSGAGDVSLLVADIVGSSGEVMGVERSPESVAWARARVEKAGVQNVRFIQADVGGVPADVMFDAVVGRFILMFIPDPAEVVRSAARLVKPGGIVVFLEPSFATRLKLSEHLPLWSQGLRIIQETLTRSGANPEMGLNLHRVFQRAGLPVPNMEMNTILGCSPDLTRWVSDVLTSMLPKIQRYGTSLEAMGDLETLPERLQAEVKAYNAVVPGLAVVGAWCTT
jgi:ubiquinone/menaquinone biosynthesis C-methylase UbiE